jgi:hypothetical protein
VSSLATVILALLSIAPGRYSRHIEAHALPPQHRAQQIAEYAEHGEVVTGISRVVLVALWYGESTLNPAAENKRTKAYGIGQILPSTPWYNAWTQDCAMDPFACEVKGAEHSARALRYYTRQCGSLLRGLTAYRAGRPNGSCLPPGPKALATIRLAQTIAYRMRVKSTRPLVAARLP